MRGDVIIVEEHHRRAADQIVGYLMRFIRESTRPYAVTVAGESGSGKSETAKALCERLSDDDVPSVILQQDDYFHLPPKSNDKRRREGIDWVGMQEVKLDLLDDHVKAIKEGVPEITKPLVIYDEDRIVDEGLAVGDARVVIAEGTYTTALKHADTRVFIDRNRLETLESRKKRGREEIEPFLEQVLEIEHRIISAQKDRADIVVTRDYEVILPEQS
ncbi:MAG: uridine kinase family protein [bacterium]